MKEVDGQDQYSETKNEQSLESEGCKPPGAGALPRENTNAKQEAISASANFAPSGGRGFDEQRHNKRKRKNGNPKKPARPPNYFLAVQITDPQIKGVMQAVQDHIVGKEKLLEKAVVDIASSHLTLGLLHLPDEETITEACDLLSNCRDALDLIMQDSPLNLEISGIGHFRKEVIYAKVVENESEHKLREIADLFKEKFVTLKADNPFSYTPHLTLMKLSKIRSWKVKKKIRRIDTKYFEGFKDLHFGCELVRSVQLLLMFKEKQPDGYYHCEIEIFPGVQQQKQADIEPNFIFANFLTRYCITSAVCEITTPKSEAFYKKPTMKALLESEQITTECVEQRDPEKNDKDEPKVIAVKNVHALPANNRGDAISATFRPSKHVEEIKSPERSKRQENQEMRMWTSKLQEPVREKKPAKPPNYFLAIQITNPQIKGAMIAAQDHIVRQNELLHKVVVSVTSAHFTLGLLHLPNEDSVTEACELLSCCKDELGDLLLSSHLDLTVSGIDHFDEKVVYAKLVQNENEQQLKIIVNFLGDKFKALKADNHFSYTPHLTLMKLGQVKSWKPRNKIRLIDSKYFESFKNMFFGIQRVKSIQLLSMSKRRQRNGYYHCEGEIPLGNPETLPEDDTDAKFSASYCVSSGICDMATSSPKKVL